MSDGMTLVQHEVVHLVHTMILMTLQYIANRKRNRRELLSI